MLFHACLRIATIALLLLCVTPSGALDDTAPLSGYGHQTWQIGSGLPQNTVRSLVQTSDGYLWIATEGGLLRFDGLEFHLLDTRSTPALPSNLVSSLAESQDGALLVGTAAGLVELRGGRSRLFTPADGLPAAPVHGIHCAGSTCWILTAAGIAAYQHGALHPLPITPALTGGAAPIAALAPDGSLWIAAPPGLARLRDGAVVQTIAVPGGVTALTIERSGGLWIGAPGVLLHWTGNHLASQPLGRPYEITALCDGGSGTLYVGTTLGLGILANGRFALRTTADGLPGDRIASLFADRSGAVWVSTDQGVARLVRSRIEPLPPSAGYALNSPVLSYLEDREGDLWLGTDASGLTVLRDQAFRTWSPSPGQAGNSLRTVFAAADGTIWMGTDGAGLIRFHNGRFSPPLTTRNGLPSDTVLSLAGDAEGALWAGTPDGLARIAGDRVTVFTAADGLPDDFVRSLYAGPDGDLWIGTRRGLAHRTRDGRVTVYSVANGLGSDIVGALAPDPTQRGALWAGTLGGLSHIAPDGHIVTINNGLSSDVVTALCPDDDGILWIGMQGGLARLRQGHISRFAPAQTGLPERISSILEDAAGDLWLGSDTGVYRVSRAGLEAYADATAPAPSVASYGVADGMNVAAIATGHPAGARAPDGVLWFATLKGLISTHPLRDRQNDPPPPVVLEKVTVDEQPAPLSASSGPTLRLSPGQRRLAFAYAGLSLRAPAKVRYRYQLEGFDRNWTDAGTRRIADYTNLPPGRYIFRVTAALNGGPWNATGAMLPLRVLPHYYQTWWFLALAALGAGALVYAGYRLRLRMVELRYQAVLQERNRIAREIHDTLAQDIVAIGVQLELAARLLSASAEAARAQLDQARALVKHSLAEARSSIWNLRSQSTAHHDLPERLAKLAAQTGAAPNAPKIVLEVHGASRPAPPQTEDQLLRIASEALTNALRHAQASRVDLRLAYGARSLDLTIADNGCGFVNDPSLARNGHFGLQGIRERAAQIQAALSIDSAPGRGTRISVRADIP